MSHAMSRCVCAITFLSLVCLEERHETQLFKRWPRSAARDRIANCDFGRSIKVSILISGMHILDINEKLYNNLIDFPTESFRFVAESCGTFQ